MEKVIKQIGDYQIRKTKRDYSGSFAIYNKKGEKSKIQYNGGTVKHLCKMPIIEFEEYALSLEYIKESK